MSLTQFGSVGLGVRIGCVTCFVGCLLGSCWRANAQFTRDDFRRADEATLRVKPRAFPNLPARVSTELERRDCTVPQPYGAARQAQNVISGGFISEGKKDWAVLCSHEKRSVILVFDEGGVPVTRMNSLQNLICNIYRSSAVAASLAIHACLR